MAKATCAIWEKYLLMEKSCLAPGFFAMLTLIFSSRPQGTPAGIQFDHRGEVAPHESL